MFNMLSTGGVQVKSVEISVNGVVVETITNLAEFTGLEIPVPGGISSLTVQGSTNVSGRDFPFDSLSIEVKEDPPPTVSIISPGEGELIIAVIAMPIIVMADDNGEITSVEGVLIVDGEATRLFFEHTADLPGMDWRTVGTIPADSVSVAIEVTVTDNLGNTATATRVIDVLSDLPPTVGLLGPGEGIEWNVEEGESFAVASEVQDDGQVVLVEYSIAGKTYPATLQYGKWVAEITIPEGPAMSAIRSKTVLPHVFVGTVHISRTSAPEGTVVTAWVEGGPPAILTLKAVATDDRGNIATAETTVQVVSRQVQVGEGVVKDGSYSLLVHQREGASFAGRTVTFRIADFEAGQTAVWQTGGGDEVNLNDPDNN